MAPALDARALNRAYLARQLLLERADMPVLDAVEHLAGLQAQAPKPPYVGLFSRLAGFDPDVLGAHLTDRSAVRISVMRGTVHLVSARDCAWMRPLTQPLHRAGLLASYRRELDGLDVDAVAETGRALLTERPYGNAELTGELAKRWPDRDPRALVMTVRDLVPLVQVPPRGVWGRSGGLVLQTAQAWLGRGLDADPDPSHLVLRHLAAFGPASVADVQAWSGLTRLAEVADRLRPRLRVFTGPDGRELLDLPDAPRPGGDVPAPARYVAEYDNLILSHADRSRVIDDAYRRRIATRNGQVPGTILVDGRVHGTWRVETTRTRAELTVTPFAPLPRAARDELEEEGRALLAFTAPSASEHEVRFTAVEG